MKKWTEIGRKIFVSSLLLMAVCFAGWAQQAVPTITYTIANDVQVSDSILEFDVYLLNTNQSVKFEASGVQLCVALNPAILNGGTITPSVVGGSSEMEKAQTPKSISFTTTAGIPMLKVAPTASVFGSSTIISGTDPGTRVARFQLINSVPFASAKANLQHRLTPLGGYISLLSYWDQGNDGLGEESTDPEAGGYLDLPLSAANAYSVASNPILSTLPTVTTDATNATTKVVTGTISALGSPKASDYGFVYSSTNANPTITDSKVSKGAPSATGEYTATLTGLTGGTTYYVCAYSTNDIGTSYGSVITLDAEDLPSTISVTGSSSFTYNGTPQGPANSNVTGSTGAVTYVYVGTGSTTYAASNTKPTTAGTYQVVASVAANGGYAGASSSAFAYNINKATLTITGLTASNKNYDGTTAATLSGGVLSGKVTGDDVTLNIGTGAFADANIGNNKPITLSGFTLSGADAGNYSLTLPTVTANITSNASTISVTGSSSFTYNSTPQGPTNSNVTGSTGAVTYVYSGTGSTTYAASNTRPTAAGTYQVVASVVANGDFDGASSTAFAFTVNKATLTITGLTASDKNYDGTTAATLSSFTMSGIYSGDDVTLNIGTGAFNDANVGNDKPITLSGFTLTGADAGNYTFTLPTLSADILASTTTISVTGSSNFTYNGTPQGPSTAQITGSTGAVTFVYSGTGSTTYAASNTKPTTVGTYQVVASVEANGSYNGASSTAFAFTINKAELTITGLTASNKDYDATTAATLSGGVLSGKAAGDDVTLNIGTGAFADPNAGIGKLVTLIGFSISGTDVNNYSLTLPTVRATISPIKPAISDPSITLNKVYDGTNNADVSAGNLSGVLPGDIGNLTLTATATYNNASVGTGKTITVTYSLSGSASGNYLAPDSYVISAGEIIPASGDQLSISEPTLTRIKEYDGTTSTAITAGTLSGIDPADLGKVSVVATANYDDINAGTGKAITVTYSLTGSAASNYSIISKVVYSNAEITRKHLTVSQTKVAAFEIEAGEYVAEVTSIGTVSGILPLDAANVQVNAFATMGAGKNVNVTYVLSGTAKDNYIAPSDIVITDVEISTGRLSADIIVKIYNDVVACDNTSNRFVAYQWYKDGGLINGATNQFFVEEGGLFGSYCVRVITTDGKVLFSEEKTFTASSVAKRNIECPNIVKQNQPFTISINGYDSQDLENSTLSFFSVQGASVLQMSDLESVNTLRLTLEPGIYIGKIKLNDGSGDTFKIIVEQ